MLFERKNGTVKGDCTESASSVQSSKANETHIQRNTFVICLGVTSSSDTSALIMRFYFDNSYEMINRDT